MVMVVMAAEVAMMTVAMMTEVVMMVMESSATEAKIDARCTVIVGWPAVIVVAGLGFIAPAHPAMTIPCPSAHQLNLLDRITRNSRAKSSSHWHRLRSRARKRSRAGKCCYSGSSKD